MTDIDIPGAMAPFSPDSLAVVDDGTPVALMHPLDFLRLASPVAARIDSAGRTEVVRALMDGGEAFSSVPCLEIAIDGDDAYVQAHDGRHRAMEILARGGTLIPVLLEARSLEDDVPAAREDLDALRLIHPQPHEEDDDYPGLDEEALEERLSPLAYLRVMSVVLDAGEIRRALIPDSRTPSR